MGRKTSARGKQSRGRPVEFDREAAVRAAMNRFWKRGFGSVPASDLADSMAITRSSLYNSFGDRESVFREALETYRRLAPDAADLHLPPADPHAEPRPEGLERGLLGGKPRRQVLGGVAAAPRVGDLVRGEDPLEKALLPALDGLADPRDVDEVDADPRDHRLSPGPRAPGRGSRAPSLRCRRSGPTAHPAIPGPGPPP